MTAPRRPPQPVAEPRESDPPLLACLRARYHARWRPEVQDWLIAAAPEALRPRVASDLAAEVPERAPGITTRSRSPLKAAAEFSELAERRRAARCPERRKRQGAFYTPAALAEYLVAAARRRWSDKATPADPTASNGRPPDGAPRWVDPACGGGVFLAAVVDAAWRECCDVEWNRRAARLLPRITGCDICPDAILATLAALAAALLETTFDFQRTTTPRLFVGDALAEPTARELAVSECDSEAPIIVGNPPFQAVTSRIGPWMRGLIGGEDGRRVGLADYLRFGDERLGERKHWLHDDYVRFLRLAHWWIELAGQGVLALVVNHGLLDNASFRLLRRWLLEDFDQIDVLDLCGNVKKGQTQPDKHGPRDENVFAIEQGVAALVCVRRPSSSLVAAGRFRATVRHDAWRGSAPSKLRRLSDAVADLRRDDEVPTTRLPPPAAPAFIFAPRDQELWDAFQAGAPLTDLMPQRFAAPVTARDALVVAFTRSELVERLSRLTNPDVSDQSIRDAFFATRSQRYLPGDTRTWKLESARRRLRACRPADWDACLRECLYRPGDVRWIFWAPWMIDWPRTGLAEALETPGSWALITRRRMLPGQANFVWATRRIAVDGVLRSDNRGSESLFPTRLGDGRWNIAAGAAARLGMAGATPETCFAVTYAQLNSRVYQSRFSACLCDDFPRVFPVRDAIAAGRLEELGRRLRETHCDAAPPDEDRADDPAGPTWIVRPGHPKHVGDIVWTAPDTPFAEAPVALWETRVGAHRPLQKWLKDRRGRPLSQTDRDRYLRMAASLAESERLKSEIDSEIESGALRW